MEFTQQALDVGLGVKDGATACLCWVCGEHWGDLRAGDELGDLVGVHAVFLQVREAGAQRNRCGRLLVVQILNQVGQQREVAKGARDKVHLGDVHVAEDSQQVLRGGVTVGDVESEAAGGFDQVEDLLAFLLSKHAAEHSA